METARHAISHSKPPLVLASPAMAVVVTGTAVENTKSLDLHMKILIYLGFWPTKVKKNRWLNVLSHTFPLILLVVTLLAIMQVVDGCYNFNNMALFTENLYLGAVGFMTVVKGGVMKLQIKDVKRLVKAFDNSKVFDHESDKKQKRIFYRHKLNTDRLTKAFLMMCLWTGMGYSLVPLTDKKVARPLPFRALLPYNATVTPNYQLTYALLSIDAIYIAVIIGLFDTLFVAMMIQAVTQFKLLQHKLENIHEIAVKNVALHCKHQGKFIATHLGSLECTLFELSALKEAHLRRKEMRKTNRHDMPLYMPFQPDPNVYSISTPLTKVFGNKLYTYANALKKQNARKYQLAKKKQQFDIGKRQIDYEMQKHIGKCIEHHRILLSYTGDLEAVFRGSLIYQLIASLLICVVFYQLTLAPEINVQALIMLSVVLSAVVQLFLYCWFSTQIFYESTKIIDAIYFSNWIDMPQQLVQSLRTMMMRSVQPFQLTVVTVALSLETFRIILKQTYSFYTLINQFDGSHAGKGSLDTGFVAANSYSY